MDCRYCGEFMAGDPDKVGARCPRCREPIYEKPDPLRRQMDDAKANGELCAVHPKNAAAVNCQRCGAAACSVCRTRWLNEVICVACLEKTLGVKQARPEDAVAHRRQALFGLALGGTAWLLLLIAGIPLLGVRGNEGDQGLAITAGVIALVSLVPALGGLGMAAAAVRVRGTRLRMATAALCVSAGHLGLVLGLLLFAVWNR